MKRKTSLTDMQAYKPNTNIPAIKLDANEANHQLHSFAISRLSNFNRYPDSYATKLRDTLASYYRLSPEHLLIGQGSSELLELIVKTFLEPGEVVLSLNPSFVMYEKYTKYYNGVFKSFALDDDMTLDLPAFLHYIDACNPKIIFLASPNNPSGSYLAKEAIYSILAKTQAILVLDEAYIEFLGEEYSMIDQVRTYKNLFVARTFSKAYGLAALRIGYLAGSKEGIKELQVVKTPYSTSTLSQDLALEAFQNKEGKDHYLDMIKRNKARLKHVLQDCKIEVFPSDANFLYVRTKKPLALEFAKKGISIRSFPNNYYRITVPSDEELPTVENALKEMTNS